MRFIGENINKSISLEEILQKNNINYKKLIKILPEELHRFPTEFRKSLSEYTIYYYDNKTAIEIDCSDTWGNWYNSYIFEDTLYQKEINDILLDKIKWR